MKPFHLKVFALFLLLLPLCVARGQSNVSVIPENVSDTSIVRYWKNNICICTITTFRRWTSGGTYLMPFSRRET